MEVRLNSPRVKFKITNMADYQVDLAPKDTEVLIRDHSIFEPPKRNDCQPSDHHFSFTTKESLDLVGMTMNE